MDPLDLRENQLMNLPNYWQLFLKCYEERESLKKNGNKMKQINLKKKKTDQSKLNLIPSTTSPKTQAHT